MIAAGLRDQPGVDACGLELVASAQRVVARARAGRQRDRLGRPFARASSCASLNCAAAAMLASTTPSPAIATARRNSGSASSTRSSASRSSATLVMGYAA
ncbi:MAG: hypothetical protein U0168_18845 [Nannocystaceae bacterium]